MILTPYVLGLYYPELDQMKSVISVFGEVSSPVRKRFLFGLWFQGSFHPVIACIVCCICKYISCVSYLVTAAIAFYGIGDCIFTGLFSINTHESSWNVSTWVHNIGSGLGYSGFIVSSSSFLIYRKWANGRKPLIPWTVCDQFAFAAIYGLARIPSINSWPLLNKIGFAKESVFFNYVPIAWLSILHLKQ